MKDIKNKDIGQDFLPLDKSLSQRLLKPLNISIVLNLLLVNYFYVKEIYCFLNIHMIYSKCKMQ